MAETGNSGLGTPSWGTSGLSLAGPVSFLAKVVGTSGARSSGETRVTYTPGKGARLQRHWPMKAFKCFFGREA